MRLIGMMRIKNSAEWVERSVGSCARMCETVIVLDDHSDDNTVELCQKFDNVVVIPSTFSGIDEVRDKNFLLKKVYEYDPDWVVTLDGDEAFSKQAIIDTSRFTAAVNPKNPHITILNYRFIYFWNDLRHYRVDGVYRKITPARVFSVWGQQKDKIHFASKYQCGFHCSNIPQVHFVARSQYVRGPVFHYGYLKKAERLRKFHWYNKVDPNNTVEGEYRHIIEEKNQWCPKELELREFVEPHE